MAVPTSLSPEDRVRRCPKHLTQKQIAPCDDEIWARIHANYRPTNVFVNIPYDASYHKMQAAIIATLLKVGLTPQLASLRSEGQPFRLCKICELMQSSKYCVTDLSNGYLQNMPFELGYCFALGRQAHSFILVDEKYTQREGRQVRKFDARISNLKGVEVIVHDNDPKKLVNRLLGRLVSDVPEAIVIGEQKKLVADILRFANRVQAAIVKESLAQLVGAYGTLLQPI